MGYKEINEHLYIGGYDFTQVADLKQLANYDNYAVRDIARLERIIADLKAYRTDLYNHVQGLQGKPYELVLTITRHKYSDGVQFYLHLEKHYDGDLKCSLLGEHYTGKERSRAIARFEQLKKEHNGIKAVKNI